MSALPLIYVNRHLRKQVRLRMSMRSAEMIPHTSGIAGWIHACSIGSLNWLMSFICVFRCNTQRQAVLTLPLRRKFRYGFRVTALNPPTGKLCG